MATTTRTVDLRYRADIAQLKSELSKVPGLTDKEAKAMVGALDRQLKRAEKAAKRTKTKTKGTFKGLEDSAGEASGVLGGLATALDVVDPKIGAAARVAGDMASGLTAALRGAGSLGPVLAGVGVAAAALGAAYAALSGGLDKANAKLERSRAELKDQSALFREVKDAAIAADLAEGRMTQEQADRLLIAQSATDLFAERIDVQTSAVREARTEYDAAQRALADLATESTAATAATVALGGSIGDIKPTLSGSAEATDALARRQTEARQRVDRLGQSLSIEQRQLEILTATQAKYADSLGRTKAIERFRDGVVDANEALTEQVDLFDDIDAVFQHRADTVEALGAIEAQAVAATLDGEALILHRRDEQLARIDALIEKTGDLEAAERARVAVATQAEGDLAEVRAKADEASAERSKAMLDDYASEQAERLRTTRDLVTSMGDAVMGWAEVALDHSLMVVSETQAALADLGENASAAERQRLLDELQAAKEQARKRFNLMKGLQIGVALATGAVSAVAALAPPPIGFGNNPLGWTMVGTTVAATGAQVATIAAQQPPFHVGGVVGSRDASEVTATLRAGEAVVTPQGLRALGGEEGLRALERGDSAADRPLHIVWQVGNRVMDEAYYPASRSGGKTRAATRSTRPRGRRNWNLNNG